jgi:hypothetical protein
MKELIIINAFPNNEFKIELLEKQLFYFKQLGIKIMVISGCDIPQKLRGQIDYLIINTDNVLINKDHAYKTFFEMNLKDTAFSYVEFDRAYYCLFGDHVNVTIVKNIKLSFKMAQMLGYKHVFYTEDDNIFKENSFPFIRSCFKELMNHDILTSHDYFANSDVLYTTFFFANIDFLLSKFTIPDERSEYYKEQNIIKYKLQKPLEVSFYEVLKNDLNRFINIKPDIDSLISNNDIQMSLNCRSNQTSYVIDRFVNLVVDENKNILIISHNASFLLPIEQQSKYSTIEVDLYFDDIHTHHDVLNVCMGRYRVVPKNVKVVKVNIKGVYEREYKIDFDTIKHNGFFSNKYL